MRERTEDIVCRLSECAEEVCRRYLSNGRKAGHYWVVGDRHNAKGRSLYLRLNGPTVGRGAAGKWTDAATGEHGDLLDIIASAIGSDRHEDAIDEAVRFLGATRFLPQTQRRHSSKASAAARLFAAGAPIARTIAADYLITRGIDPGVAAEAVRFHARCYCRSSDTNARRELPAMLAAVTDNQGRVTGLMRTYLSVAESDVPHVLSRRAMGALAGNGVRFGPDADVMAAGEGIETVLSLRMAMPRMSMIAALSAAHLGTLVPPKRLRRLYIAVDRDAAGRNAAARLQERLRALSVETILLTPQRTDLNDDLVADGSLIFAAQIGDQLYANDQALLLGAS